MRAPILFLVVLLVATAHGEWIKQASGGKVQFRGLSAVNRRVCWAAGSEGTFGRTVDGHSWQFTQVKGAETMTFRGVVAFDAMKATLLAIGPGEASRVYNTQDGGTTWTLQFKNRDPKAFYDGIAFWDAQRGISLSDPVDGKFRLLITTDGGAHWRPRPGPVALAGEGAFAASNSCLVVKGKSDVWFATGSAIQRRVLHSKDAGKTWSIVATDPAAAVASAGTFGLAFRTLTDGVAVGGDYKQPAAGTGQLALTKDGGKSWVVPAHTPVGLRECAAYVPGGVIVVGPDGTNFSTDGGKTWPSISPETKGLHVCAFAQGSLWAAGDQGLIVAFYTKLPKKVPSK